jgi:hypothetical protein
MRMPRSRRQERMHATTLAEGGAVRSSGCGMVYTRADEDRRFGGFIGFSAIWAPRMEGGQRLVVGCCMLNAQCMPCMGYVSVTAGGVCITVAGGARRPRRISVPFFRL